MEQKNGEFKLEVLKILRGFQNLDEISKQDRKRFKEEMDENELYAYYRDMYKEALREYKLTFKDFYYRRDKSIMEYRKNVRNQVRVKSDGKHPNPHQQIQSQLQRGTKTGISTGKDYGEHN